MSEGPISTTPALRTVARKPQAIKATAEPAWVQALLVILAIAFLALFLLVPLLTVFAQALKMGLGVYWQSLTDPDALAAIRLTLLTALVCVPMGTFFGVAAAWCIGKFQFWGKHLLITLIDLPFSVSPVIAGLLFVLLFGREGWLGPGLDASGIKIIYATPGIILVTMFVTSPFVARELIPLMESQGVEEEEAARVLGASGWQIFWRVTLPNVKWGLFYGIILCNARAMGEFGAVSVVSGHIRGYTNTMPLHVESMYNDFSTHSYVAAFAVASLLAFLALVTLVVKTIVEWQVARQQKEMAAEGGRSPLAEAA
ncbi:MAG: sulfate ABC transporter permease subunit CysW [Planctomycetota bacterium]